MFPLCRQAPRGTQETCCLAPVWPPGAVMAEIGERKTINRALASVQWPQQVVQRFLLGGTEGPR